MPLYEYLCDACGRRFEEIRKFSDPPVETCPTCGGRVQKVISAPAFQLKGTGWYITDYAKKDSGGAAPGTAGKDAKSESTEKADKTEAPDKSTSEKSTSDKSTSDKTPSDKTKSSGETSSSGSKPSTSEPKTGS